MRTIKDIVEECALLGQFGAHPFVQRFEIGFRIPAQRNAALIGDYDRQKSGGFKQTNPRDHFRQQPELFPLLDILAWLAVRR